MPEDGMADYLDAASIANLSPRGAAAILRTAVLRMCVDLRQPGKNIDDDISALVTAGLDNRVQKSFDVVRVIGNHAVHPGQLNVNDRPQDVQTLFTIINEIIEEMIGNPKRLDALYDSLAAPNLEAIEKRNDRAHRKSPPEEQGG